MTGRVRVNLGIASEDVMFLDDQLSPRLQSMSHKVDEEFAKRKASSSNLKRKATSVPQSGPSSAKSPSNVNTEEDDDEDEETLGPSGDHDKDYVDSSRKEKRSDRINVSIPRNIFMSPALIREFWLPFSKHLKKKTERGWNLRI